MPVTNTDAGKSIQLDRANPAHTYTVASDTDTAMPQCGRVVIRCATAAGATSSEKINSTPIIGVAIDVTNASATRNRIDNRPGRAPRPSATSLSRDPNRRGRYNAA